MLANKYLISVGAGLALGLSVQASASMLTDQSITSLLAVQDKALRKAGPLALDDIAHADPLGTSGASARKAPSGIDYRPGQTQASLTLTDPALVEALEGLVIALDRSETLAPDAREGLSQALQALQSVQTGPIQFKALGIAAPFAANAGPDCANGAGARS